MCRYTANLFERQDAHAMLKKAIENENEEELREALKRCLNIGVQESTIQIVQQNLLSMKERNKLAKQMDKHLEDKNIKQVERLLERYR